MFFSHFLWLQILFSYLFFFSSRRRHTRCLSDWSSDVCSSDLNLQYLYEAARLGSMRAAADLLAVAASSISRQIAQLEGEVGTALIERGARRLRLTEAGRLLIEY